MKYFILSIVTVLVWPISPFCQTFEFVKSFKVENHEAMAWHGGNDLVIIGTQYGPKAIHSILGERVNPDEFSNTYSTQREFPLRVEKNSTDGVKMGIIGNGGNYLVPCVYEKINPWIFGYCIAERDGKYFMISSKGKITPLGDDVQEASIVMTGIAACENKREKVGLINEDGQLIVDFKYRAIEKIRSFDNHDFGMVTFSDNSYEDGLIDNTGKILLPIVKGNKFKTAGHRLFVGRGSKSGVLEKDGSINFTIPFGIMDLPISPFGERVGQFGVYTVGSGREAKYGIIDSNYNVVMPAKYPLLVMLNDIYALASGCGFFPSKDCSRLDAIINVLGDTILIDSFEIPLQVMGTNAIIATTDHKNIGYYWYDSKGEKILPYPISIPSWGFKVGDELKIISIKRKNQNYCHLFNGEGKVVTMDSFLSTSLIENTDLIWVEKDKGQYGVMDVNGTQIVPNELTWPILVFRDERLINKDPNSVVGFMGIRKGKATIFNKKGDVIFEKEGKFSVFTNDYLWLKKDTSYDIYKINW